MKMSVETRRAVSVILFYSAGLFVLLGFASRIKMNFHGRMEISSTSFVTAAVLAAFGIILLLSSLGKKA
jgi:anaerobic C4-dicarboxylate transporter